MDQLTPYAALSRLDYVRRPELVMDYKLSPFEQEESKLPVGLRLLSILALSATLWTGIIGTAALAWHCLRYLA
jgi:hypothetical protein